MKGIIILILTLYAGLAFPQKDTINQDDINLVGTLIEGKKIGIWVEYKGKRKIAEYQYGNGAGLVTKSEYSNGQIVSQLTYIQSNDSLILNGPLTNYLNGNLYSHGIYSNGTPVGAWLYYYPNTSIIQSIDNYGDQYTEVFYHQSFSNQEVIMEEGYLLMYHGRIGQWKEYHPSGSLKSKGAYFPITTTKPKEIIMDANTIVETEENVHTKTGKWTYYDENGNVEKVEYWDKGVLIPEYAIDLHCFVESPMIATF